MEEFDEKSLARYNGKDEKRIYIAYKGKVYDVTESKLWKTGTHMNRHFAGKDLTDELPAAPHGEEVFSKFKIVGTYKTGTHKTPSDERIPKWLSDLIEKYPALKRHPHPILVHFPLAFMIGTSLFALLYAIFGVKSFDTTAFDLMVAGLVFSVFAIASGFFTWYLNYMSKPIKAVIIKIVFSFVLDADAIILIWWRSAYPNILINVRNFSFDSLIFFIMTLLLAFFAMIIGYYGGELVYPTGKK
ncbi:MAG: cytochrome b5 [Mesoaciditoga sp.]|nr:MAG: cytochrome b5 [Mesoaciditoga sp.]PMP80052.1 MAG: cytochrome b5 [Mesoaciditoga sp.]HEU24024.1 cytochrome b5 [Mesoaciditoga lauensis]